MKETIPIWEKYLLTPEEASELVGLPASFFRMAGQLTRDRKYDLPCSWNGERLKINRVLLQKWLDSKSDGRTNFKMSFILKDIENRNSQQRGRPRKAR